MRPNSVDRAGLIARMANLQYKCVGVCILQSFTNIFIFMNAFFFFGVIKYLFIHYSRLLYTFFSRESLLAQIVISNKNTSYKYMSQTASPSFRGWCVIIKTSLGT